MDCTACARAAESRDVGTGALRRRRARAGATEHSAHNFLVQRTIANESGHCGARPHGAVGGVIRVIDNLPHSLASLRREGYSRLQPRGVQEGYSRAAGGREVGERWGTAGLQEGERWARGGVQQGCRRARGGVQQGDRWAPGGRQAGDGRATAGVQATGDRRGTDDRWQGYRRREGCRLEASRARGYRRRARMAEGMSEEELALLTHHLRARCGVEEEV
jgi:hypothetical protein